MDVDHGEAAVEPINLAVVAGKVFLAVKPKTVARLKSWLRGRAKVVVLGSTGVGKTQLIDSLTELLPRAISYLDRTTFSAHDDIQIGSQFFRVWDTPGQAASVTDRAVTLPAVSGKPFGVINVVSYGYHEYRADLATVFSSDGSVREAFLERHRGIEIEQLKTVLPHLTGNSNLRWFITVIAKADLWWGERDKVFDHYENGTYAHEACRLFRGSADASSLSTVQW